MWISREQWEEFKDWKQEMKSLADRVRILEMHYHAERPIPVSNRGDYLTASEAVKVMLDHFGLKFVFQRGTPDAVVLQKREKK